MRACATRRSDGLLDDLSARLRREHGLNPYVVPMGGSNHIGLWGYLAMAEELAFQQRQLGLRFDHIVRVVLLRLTWLSCWQWVVLLIGVAVW